MQGNGKMFMLLYGSLEPLLSVLEEVVMSEEGNCKRYVGTWWCQVAVLKCLVDDV